MSLVKDARVSDVKADYVVELNGRDVTEFATASLSLEDAVNRIYSKLSLGFIQTEFHRLNVEVGMKIKLRYKTLTLFDGIIFNASYADNYSISITAYDYGIYYAKNYVSTRYKNTTAGTIIKSVVKDAGLPLGDVADTRYIIPEYVADDKDVQAIIYELLDITYAQTGVRFYPVLRDNKLHIAKSIKPKEAVVISETNNLIAVSREVSIDDLANYIVVRGGDKDKPTTSIAKDDASIAKYGRMMMVDSVDEKAKPSHARDRANSLLKDNKKPTSSASLTAIGNFNILAGSHVYVEESRTGTVGEYVVTDVTHNVNMTSHTMSLKLEEAK